MPGPCWPSFSRQTSREWGYCELFLHVERDDIRKLYNRYGYTATYQKPTWFELNLMNVVVKPIEAEDLVSLDELSTRALQVPTGRGFLRQGLRV